jgi:hypothetical protein
MWEPLRLNGEDAGLVTLSVQETDRLEIEFVLPAGTKDVQLIGDPQVGTIEVTEAEGMTLRWITAPAAPGPYSYRLSGRIA